MTELIKTPFYDDFLELCGNSRKSIRFCAPYIKEDVFSDLLSNKRDEVSLELITKINLRDYHSKVSDLGAVKATVQRGGRVYNCSNLHAKVYIFDGRQCIITSANLTSSGLKRNAECGILTDDAALVGSALAFYNGIAEREDVGIITGREVAEIEGLLEKIPPPQRINYPKLDGRIPAERDVLTILNGLSGWKRDIFLSLGQFGDVFTSLEVGIIAEQLREAHLDNNNREAKVRQVLQQLRDLGLVEFSSPGVYKKLWV